MTNQDFPTYDDWNDIKNMLETPGIVYLIAASGADIESAQLEIERWVSKLTLFGNAHAAFVHFDLPSIAMPFMKPVMLQVRAMCTTHATIIQSYRVVAHAHISVLLLVVIQKRKIILPKA